MEYCIPCLCQALFASHHSLLHLLPVPHQTILQLTPFRLLPQPGGQFSCTAEPDSFQADSNSPAERALQVCH